MLITQSREEPCRFYSKAITQLKPIFCKASGVGDRTFCEKCGLCLPLSLIPAPESLQQVLEVARSRGESDR